MNDMTPYALGYAALLAAAIAVMGLIASTSEPARATAPEPQAVVVHADAAYVAATMNIPF